MRKVHKLIIKNPLKMIDINLVKYIYIQKIFSKVDWDSRILKTTVKLSHSTCIEMALFPLTFLHYLAYKDNRVRIIKKT